jgi:hypothetical protein
MTFGPRHTTTDEYDQDVQVDVEVGDAVVCLGWHEAMHAPAPSIRRTHAALSKLTPDQADKVAEQLRAAAEHARTLEPHA